MKDTIRTKAEEILHKITTQSFDDFYKGRLDDYITGVTGDKQREEILEEIVYIFKLND